MRHKLAIVGRSPSKQLAPYKDPSFDIWTVVGHKIPRVDTYFDIHDPSVWAQEKEKKSYKEHINYLKDERVPVYLYKKDPLLPMSITYPTELVLSHFRDFFVDPKQSTYLTNSIDYMLAMAIDVAYYREIHLYGCDMKLPHYHYQHRGVSFWLGVAVGRGIKVYTTPQSTLLNCPLLYGTVRKEKWKEMTQIAFGGLPCVE